MQTRTVEIIVSSLFISVAAIVMYDSRTLGAGWGFDGPETGYFPFYIALMMLGSSAVTLVQAASGGAREAFSEPAAFRRMLKVLVPTAVYVAAIPFTGIYAAAALFIAYFMVVVGGYRPAPAAAIAVAVPLTVFILFEIWFLVPLPKGPIEAALGY